MSSTEPILVPEEELANRVGADRSLMRAWRKSLDEGRDWRTENRRIMFTPEGAKKIVERAARELAQDAPQATGGGLGMAGGEDGPPLQALLDQPRPERAQMVVISKPMNTKIVLCKKIVAAGPVLERVRVQASANFLPGMKLTALHEQGTVWTLVGRCPRWRGRW